MVRGAGLCSRHGLRLAPGKPAAERDSFSEVVLVGCLREAIRVKCFKLHYSGLDLCPDKMTA